MREIKDLLGGIEYQLKKINAAMERESDSCSGESSIPTINLGDFNISVEDADDIELELEDMGLRLKAIIETGLEEVTHNNPNVIVDDYYNKDYHLRFKDDLRGYLGEDNYLNYKQESGRYMLCDKFQTDEWQTKFTKEEIDDLDIIKERFYLIEL